MSAMEEDIVAGEGAMVNRKLAVVTVTVSSTAVGSQAVTLNNNIGRLRRDQTKAKLNLFDLHAIHLARGN